MRREITQRVVGSNGSYTHEFGPATINTLLNLGLIKLDTSESYAQPEFDRIVELHIYKKA